MINWFVLGSQSLPSQDPVFGKKTKLDSYPAWKLQKTQLLLYHTMHVTHRNVSSKIIYLIGILQNSALWLGILKYFLKITRRLPAAADTVILVLIVLPWPDALNCYILQTFMGHRALIHQYHYHSFWNMFCGLSAECPKTATTHLHHSLSPVYFFFFFFHLCIST